MTRRLENLTLLRFGIAAAVGVVFLVVWLAGKWGWLG